MRIWQKIYLVTLAVFLVMLNAGLFFAASFIFRHNLMLEREQAKTECHFLIQNLEHDFSILEKNERYEEEIIAAVVQGYQNYYSLKNTVMELKETKEDAADVLWSTVEQGGNRVYVKVEQMLEEPYGEYTLFYEKELVELEDLWRRTKRTFAWISLAMSLALCAMLYFLMKRFLKPLDRLSAGVAEIAAGQYEQKIVCRGKDEIAELAESVNRMSGEIQRQIAALEEENQKKQQLMDNMAHELRTPLTAIYGYAEYLQRARASQEETYEGLSYIMRESRRLAKMGDMMLSMRMYQRGEVQLEPVSLEKVASHVSQLLEGELQKKQLTLLRNLPFVNVMGEEVMLVNLFRNLLENAIRASRAEEDIIWSGCHKKADVVIQIVDKGVGMDKEELKRITEPFYRVDRARSREDGGAGLGLSIVELIVKLHGGTLTFVSEKGMGTTVTVTLPALGDEAAAVAVENTREQLR